MSTTKNTREQAVKTQQSIETTFKDMPWFKKVVLANDDHGFSLDLYINKTQMESSGMVYENPDRVKICIFNVN